MAAAWEKVRLTFLPSSALNAPKSLNQWGKVYQGSLPKRVENLNAPNGRAPRSKSSIKMGSENSLQPSVKLDYSDTYRENEALDGDLEVHLNGLKRMEKRQLLEKGEQLKEIRKQVEVITRLQEAVNSRKPGHSAGMVVSRASRPSIQYGRASTQYGRSNSRRASRPALVEEKSEPAVPDIDFAVVAQATRTQMRIAAEREKYSAKNLFNVRRPKTALGNYSMIDKPTVPQTRLFAGPAVTTNSDNRDFTDSSNDNGQSRRLDENIHNRPMSSSKNSVSSNNRPATASSGHLINGHGSGYDNENSVSDDIFFHKSGFQQNRQGRKTPVKGYLRPTTASRGGGQLNVNSDNTNDFNNNNNNHSNRRVRPKTAVGFVTRDEEKPDDLLPPRAQSAVMRSRSRRQLELLCRAMDPEVEEAAAAAAAIVSGDAKEWELVNEKRRRKKLKKLRQEGQELDARVQRFLTDIDGFNKKCSPSKTRPSSAGFALHIVSGFQEDF
ncbi:hypothetical protein EGW08_003571 [Elysia chlorotica]|uniref:Uncharacterized protein n=1 Tax=Elysia chlorotica TaxID=188477 RepID=A0A433U4D1_ELYCH|nr:hypothetical protein EGW08_003571 [Elysia chlorotica]